MYTWCLCFSLVHGAFNGAFSCLFDAFASFICSATSDGWACISLYQDFLSVSLPLLFAFVLHSHGLA